MEAAGKRYISYRSKSDEFTIYNLSDVHIGSRACALESFEADVKRIAADPFAFWVGGGDYCDHISVTDRKRFDPEAMAENITVKDLAQLGRVLVRQFAEIVQPIKHKCLGLLLGNHETRYQREQEQADLHGWLCTELDAPNLQYSALFDVVFVKTAKRAQPKLLSGDPGAVGSKAEYRVFVHHGAGFATTPGGKLNKLIQFMEAFDADVYMVGHVHDQKGQRLVQVGADATCRKLIAKDRLGIISGSYLKTYAEGVTSYGEQRAYRPTPLGAAFVRIQPYHRRVRAEI